jgi:tetratricopeptide (TPR) repeat protein
MARGDSLHESLLPGDALEAYRAAYFERQTYEAMWKFSLAQIDVARQLGDDRKDLRDSLYNVAHMYANAAVRADSSDAEGYFMLSLALGRVSLTKGGRERVRYAKEIYDAVTRAIELDPEHDGAYHVLGMWHAEVLRLSGIARFFAKTFLGADFMGIASWDSATAYLERAVEIRPEDLLHRYDLAEIYVDTERYADARRQLEEVLRLQPTVDVLDPQTQADAAALLEEIRER